MSKGEQTRQKILNRALAMASELGMEGISIGALAEEASLSKSGLFAHFKSKEALQLEVLQEAINRFTAQVAQPVLAAPRGEARLRLLFDKYLEWLRGDDERLGCPFQKMAAEYSNRDGAVRERLVESMRDWRDQVGRVVTHAVESGFLRADLDVPMFVHEFAGIAMVFQQSCRLMRDPKAESRARQVFEALLQRSRREPAAS
jgi:AcrR family transcriptional regulator